ncbi:Wound-responsive family protein, putative isoform 2 [Hibiscus syriacus]|uniref:Wound-responsive family protein, putative isoform 2 n=1 Tax=Hibiscus syriacus TaxID=106335 RepID=A0A6A3CZY5_HIBSY|nr:Wound-responsive family protein, putative isoform 2 [Hibiscus syriacus]
MEDNCAVGGEPSRVVAPKMVKAGDRQVFTVELRPGETTYVSWRKLVKDANRAHGSSPASVSVAATTSVVAVPTPEPPPNAHPNLQSRIAPGQTVDKEKKDEPAPNRFSAVIEKIERLYVGKDSSDEEELDETPDDDQYDTEDSFIDDAELDEYFEVDNSAIKHDGFFVNRGKLERIIEPPVVPSQQPKKRRRRDAEKLPNESDNGCVSNKHAKAAKMMSGRPEPPHAKNNSKSPQNLTAFDEQYRDVKAQNQLSVSGVPSKKKYSETILALDSSSYFKDPNGGTSVPLADVKYTENSKIGFPPSKSVVSNNLNDATGSSHVLPQKYHDKSALIQSKPQHEKLSRNGDKLEQSVRTRENNGVCELPDINKSSHMVKKDGFTLRPKSSVLEKAIRELEKIVAESRPPANGNQEADASSQGIKRRLPREIKLKLAKVARLAASQGKVSKELLSRLMSILGHLIQLRTLKRNLKIMINMGVSPTAKQEKDARLQQIKKEVTEMIKTRLPPFETKACFTLSLSASDDFQEVGSEERVFRKKFSMDAPLENKICELYDLYVDGLDEDAGPQIRKLYVELAQLWPNGMMDNHDIKRAICRAKERRRARYNRRKDQEKMRKKMLDPGVESARVDSSSSAQSQHTQEKSASDPGIRSLLSIHKSISITTTAAVHVPSPSTNDSSFDRLKQDKLKGISSSAMDDEFKMADASLPKKKVKRKPESELDEPHFQPEKLAPQQGTSDRHKSIKQPTNLAPKSNVPATATGFKH